MLSAKYHVAFWLISITARFIFELIETIPWNRDPFQAIILPSLAAQIIFIWTGPSPKWMGVMAPCYIVMTSCLLTSVGASISDFDDNDPRGVALTRAIHVLLAYTILGVLEPIRQNVRRIAF